jgi:hypothetical protein
MRHTGFAVALLLSSAAWAADVQLGANVTLHGTLNPSQDPRLDRGHPSYSYVDVDRAVIVSGAPGAKPEIVHNVSRIQIVIDASTVDAYTRNLGQRVWMQGSVSRRAANQYTELVMTPRTIVPESQMSIDPVAPAPARP